MVEVLAAWSRSASRRAAAWGWPVSDTVDAIVRDARVEAVLLLTPPNACVALVEAFAGAGKHILSEKPLERSTAAAERIVATCAVAGVRLGVVLQHRLRPAALRLRALLAEGALGEPCVVQLAGEAQTGGGADPMAFSNAAHRAVIANFVGAVREGREPAVSGAAALGVHRLIDPPLASSREGRAVVP